MQALQNYLLKCNWRKYFCQQQQNYMFNFFCIELDLPTLSPHLINQALDCSDNNLIIKSTDRVLSENGIEYRNGTNRRYKVSEDIHSWVRQNITDEYSDISTQILTGGSCMGPHLDKLRIYHLFYLLETGGDDHQTVWYQEPGKSIFRTDFAIFNNISELKELHTTKIPVGKWVLFNSKIIHDVRNLDKNLARKTLTIDMLYMPKKFVSIAEQTVQYTQ